MATSVSDREAARVTEPRRAPRRVLTWIAIGLVALVAAVAAYWALTRSGTAPAPPAVTRAGVLKRDGRHCAYCQGRAETVDHVVPRSRGGGHSWENCVACCARCNARKADRLLAEIGWCLPTVPGPPRRGVLGRMWANEESDPAWEPWLPSAA